MEFMELLRARHSVRKFRGEPVAEELVAEDSGGGADGARRREIFSLMRFTW